MTVLSSVWSAMLVAVPNIVQTSVDPVDLAIIQHLSRDGRMPNNALAEAVGIAPSTCLGRVRALRKRGVIRGFTADIDPSAVGLPMQAMIAVSLRVHDRKQIDDFRATATRLPGVISVFHVAGENDYLLHVAARSADALRDFVLDHLTAHPAVGHAKTSLIFEHLRGRGLLKAPATER